MTIIKNFITGVYNENALARLVRAALMAAIAGAAIAIAQVLPGIDIPGSYDALIVGLAVPALVGIDKWARGNE